MTMYLPNPQLHPVPPELDLDRPHGFAYTTE
jgi:hypothetical protein